MTNKTIYLVSNMGNSFGFEMKLAVEWFQSNTEYDLIISSNFNTIEDFVNNTKIKLSRKINYVKFGDDKELELMNKADVLISDLAISSKYEIKSWQRYYNIWHGIPYKKMGKERESIRDGRWEKKIPKPPNVDKVFCASSHASKAISDAFDVPISKFELANFLKYQINTFPKNKNGKVLVVYTWEDFKNDAYEKTIKKFRLLNDSIKKFKYPDSFDVLLHHETLKNTSIVNSIKAMESFNILDGKESFDETMKRYEYIITDYSSAIFDCIFHEKKLIIDSSLIQDYNSYWGVYDSVDQDLERYKVNSKDEVVKMIMNGEVKVFNNSEIIDKYMNGNKTIWIEEV